MENKILPLGVSIWRTIDDQSILQNGINELD